MNDDVEPLKVRAGREVVTPPLSPPAAAAASESPPSIENELASGFRFDAGLWPLPPPMGTAPLAFALCGPSKPFPSRSAP
jgi:hypothetical protein